MIKIKEPMPSENPDIKRIIGICYDYREEGTETLDAKIGTAATVNDLMRFLTLLAKAMVGGGIEYRHSYLISFFNSDGEHIGLTLDGIWERLK